ncbi:MAG: type I DNA topoisomerase [Prevotellaceae bacterium]|jgi:DNA topoisomerase-1|nr:type I DNA topoisomerase [Prevotellaceae bacterium]
MQENLVIVESPAKAKTIEKLLGKDYFVTSSYGHIRDLEKKGLGVDVNDNFKPEYVVSPDKKKLVEELKKLSKQAKTVWLASDEDREGEAIAWHLYNVLKLDDKNTKRITFNEITKNAILEAIQNPRTIDINLVNAQQARRILDRLVGFEVSPILWKKIKSSLSAGRVQSVAVRLIVEREREIMEFKTETAYKVSAIFISADEKQKFQLKATLSADFKTEKEAKVFLEKCKDAIFTVEGVDKKPTKKSPSAPFTTSTLQQEASRKFRFSVAQTMNIAQRLYERGLITYMRTDSTNLSTLALGAAKNTIENLFGEKYVKTRQYKTKSKSAQEAHEAIRPTYLQNTEIEGAPQEKKLYDLIWKRTIASQMADAELEKTTININISDETKKFQATGEVIIFDGFLKVYMESNDDDNENAETTGLLPALVAGQTVARKEITATQRFSQHPPRYTEASLVKKLEELGIGRPSTYAPTISTIIAREYVLKEDRAGVERSYTKMTLKTKDIVTENLKEIVGAEKTKFFPSDIGIVVTDFLIENFSNILDFSFTAKIEEYFDEIAEGKLDWVVMLHKFYKPFHKKVDESLETAQLANAERILGIDPKSGKQVSARIARFGPIAQLGTNDDPEKKFSSLKKDQLIETLTLGEALKLFDLPRTVGEYEGKEIVASTGRFGPYVRHDSKFISMKKEDDPYTITEKRAIELIEEKRKKDSEKNIAKFGDIEVLNGFYGPYITCDGKNYKIPKGQDPKTLTHQDCIALISEQKGKEPKTKTRAKTKKPASRK